MADTVEVAVIGGGPAGLTAAVALASAGVTTVLVAKHPPPDNRTTALLSGSVAALEALEVWPLCRAQSAPLTAIRLIDDTARLIRAPRSCLRRTRSASRHLATTSRTAIFWRRWSAARPPCPRCGASRAAAVAIEADDSGVAISLEDGGTLTAGLVVARTAANRSAGRRPVSRPRGAAIRRPR